MKIAILGGGSVTTEYYLPALRLMGRLADVAVIDRASASIGLRPSEFGKVEFRNQDYVSFLKDSITAEHDEPQSVIVALPNQFHVDAVRLALEQRRHVLCEKPLALAVSDCLELRALAAEKGRVLKVAMSRRYLPSLMLVREIVGAKELGQVRAIEVHDCTPFLWRPRSFTFFATEAGGVLADMGVHYLDFLDTLIGPLKPLAYSDDAKGGTESSLTYKLVAGDVPIEMRLSRIHQSGAYIKIVCERGEIVVSKANENEAVVTPFGSLCRRVSAERPFDEVGWPKSFQGGFCQLLADFERAVAGCATRIADAADAERTVGLIEWAYERRRRVMPATTTHSAETTNQGKVLVTGGTGFIGGHLVERLSSGGSDIRVAVRSPGKCANVSRFPAKLVPTDLLDKKSVEAAVAGARIIYHLAYGNDGKDPARITIDGTKNIVEAAISAGADCVVVLSTMYVFGFPQGVASVDESFPYRPYGGEYGQSKAIMERWCLNRARSSLPTRIVVLNPTCVFGPGGGAYTSLPVDLARQGRFCWINGGSGLCNYNYVENLIDAIMAATQVREAHGNRFIISDGAVTWREFLEPMIRPFVSDAIPSYTSAELKKLPRYGSPFSLSDLVSAILFAPRVRDAAKRSKSLRSLALLARTMRSDAVLDRAVPAGQVNCAEAEHRFPPEWLAPLFGPARTLLSAKKANDILKWRPAVELASGLSQTVDWLIDNMGLPDSAERD